MKMRNAAAVALLGTLYLSACGPSTPDDSAGFNLNTPVPTSTPTPTSTSTPILTTATPTKATTHQVVIRIDGADGASFRGQISDATSSRSIDGTIPEVIPLMNARGHVSVSVNITDTGRKLLALKVYSDGVLKEDQQTSGEFASLSVLVDLD